ncbi:MAG: bifunctional 2-methylcitrate dehydratase/aconitate hydratase [Gammaproteobacteria bacterium]|nr:bifunctional 2-methylcitrate dehydratase/aconitate hydratase [Gammaproteobacteria bacterium]
MSDTTSPGDDNRRAVTDELLVKIADYVCAYQEPGNEAIETARYALFDALGCSILALQTEECRKRLGPVVPGATLTHGVPVPGTEYQLEPIQAAFNIGTQVRWLDYNDTWLAAEWGHPSDNLGAILACADYRNRHLCSDLPPLTMRDVTNAMIQAYEIQGVIALKNSFNRLGIDHVILVKIASTAVATLLLGGDRKMIINALANAWADGGTLRSYRHAPDTGWRKSWAAGDATSRAVRHALMAINGEMGYPNTLTTPQWGFEDVCFNQQPLLIEREFGNYIMENILFKVSYPVEFHAQTAVECAVQLHQNMASKINQIKQIELHTQNAAMRIINKTGPLHNHADRDHSLQYAVAIALIFGTLESHHYRDEIAADPRIDQLRNKMKVFEDKQFSADYLDADKRAIGNRVTIHFENGTTETACIEYPIGHRRRRSDAIPLLELKFHHNLAQHYRAVQKNSLTALMLDQAALDTMPVDKFMDLWRIDQTTELSD